MATLKMDYPFDMDRRILSILCIFLIYVKPEADLSIAVRKFNHLKDMSEYCRRRVVPSVFIGKQVMDASAHIVHFSQLEVPYSCSFSVRTESGNNIVLVLQLLSEMDLVNACALNSNQLIVYEFGETFGGYWGHLPDAMMKKTTWDYTRFYTLKTTKPTTTRSLPFYYETDSAVSLTQTEPPVPTERPQDFITMEVPLVNVSGNFQSGRQSTHNAEEMFDFIYDVIPKNGVEYETSVLPLVQFSIRQQKVEPERYGQKQRYDSERRYELDYVFNRFTFDPRLLYNTANKRVLTKKIKWSPSTRLHFQKKTFRKLFTPRIKSYSTKNRSVTKTVTATPNSSSRENAHLRRHSTTNFGLSVKPIHSTPHLIDNENNVKNASNSASTKDMQPIPLSITTLTNNKMIHNENMNNNSQKIILKSRNDEIPTYSNEKGHTENKFDSVRGNISTMIPSNSSKENKSHINNSEPTKLGAMVDHESWENVVQAAPVMAVVLNNTDIRQRTKQLTDVDRRKRRHVQALEIENSRPRNLTTQRVMQTETEHQFSNIQDLAGLVELQDDEIGGRLALRYLRNYVGSVLFNICDFQEAKSRQVFLFNSSRIVIAVNNFSMEGMTLVLTPAQSLGGSMSMCEPGHLECQIVGSRVCIDSTNACDAVPNCGSYDIYDEDRLKCGVNKGLQHNVYLAAFTFLAVILTTVYTVHYWLKRCVPKVSDAFFIYTDDTENTLYLDSIMRSPNEVDEPSHKYPYPRYFFDSDILHKSSLDEVSENFCSKILRKCFTILLCKKTHIEHPDYINEVYSSAALNQTNEYSFAEYELRKFMQSKLKEEGVQTGESLEIPAKTNEEKKNELLCDTLKDPYKPEDANEQNNREKHLDELTLIKFTKEARSSTQGDTLSINQTKRLEERLMANDEKEVKSTVFDHNSNANVNGEKIRVKCEVHSEKIKQNVDVTKRLRFDKELRIIPSVETVHEMSADTTSKRSVICGTVSRNKDLDMITEDDSEASSSKDFKRFWGMSKSKKGKKKKEKQLTARYY